MLTFRGAARTVTGSKHLLELPGGRRLLLDGGLFQGRRAESAGRTQEIVYALDQLWHDQRLPPIPVYVDSPLAVNATGVYLAHPECFDRGLLAYMQQGGDGDPLGFERLTYIRDVSRSKALNDMRVPMVIISASGMAEAGRILHHLKNNIEDPRNTVMIVGYCADHTLGKKIDPLPCLETNSKSNASPLVLPHLHISSAAGRRGSWPGGRIRRPSDAARCARGRPGCW